MKMSDTKQVRVDNWGVFFLQRLQIFFSKTDYCDMTLQFDENVQLKVHRLVMNACTDYFLFLEETCGTEDNTILMPSDLQADVIVPIVNFMYTGMLEFKLSIFEKLYRTAEVMNLSILIKLLDAQRQTVFSSVKNTKKKYLESSSGKKIKIDSSSITNLSKKVTNWKRKTISQPYSHISSGFSESKWSSTNNESLIISDNSPKPTRFEWPEDLPTINLMDTSFGDISYTSKPLLTQQEEKRKNVVFDDLKQLPNNEVTISVKKSLTSLNLDEVKDYVKQQKIRSDLTYNNTSDENIDNDFDFINNNDAYDDDDDDDDDENETLINIKRKSNDIKDKHLMKKIKLDDDKNKSPIISISADVKNTNDLNHGKIVAELLKKYPDLMKKNKNIRLKIMAKNKTTTLDTVISTSPTDTIKTNELPTVVKSQDYKKKITNTVKSQPPWHCDICRNDNKPLEFPLYYLFRKHMTDVHNEKFDQKLCKYCGEKCNKDNLMIYHLYTKHGMKPTSNYTFPKCNCCPYIAFNDNILNKHKLRHDTNEIQCVECKLTFTSLTTLTTHLQITGHGKTHKNNFDCQYCTKRYQSSINLFTHVKIQHHDEAIRDGMVSIDESFDVDEDYNDDNNGKQQEYITEICDGGSDSIKKINILSNVKINNQNDLTTDNATSTIATATTTPSSTTTSTTTTPTPTTLDTVTNLGLVDIVVLDDNQQLFVQSNQQHDDNDNNRPEYILPELTGDNYTSQQVITTTSNVLTENDISSTDELVMVLTDHDYDENQEENNDNSNIVVLYSHPISEDNQIYTSTTNNIVVNSETGMIEITNNPSITTTTLTTTTTTTTTSLTTNDTMIPEESVDAIQNELLLTNDLKRHNIQSVVVYEEKNDKNDDNQVINDNNQQIQEQEEQQQELPQEEEEEQEEQQQHKETEQQQQQEDEQEEVEINNFCSDLVVNKPTNIDNNNLIDNLNDNEKNSIQTELCSDNNQDQDILTKMEESSSSSTTIIKIENNSINQDDSFNLDNNDNNKGSNGEVDNNTIIITTNNDNVEYHQQNNNTNTQNNISNDVIESLEINNLNNEENHNNNNDNNDNEKIDNKIIEEIEVKVEFDDTNKHQLDNIIVEGDNNDNDNDNDNDNNGDNISGKTNKTEQTKFSILNDWDDTESPNTADETVNKIVNEWKDDDDDESKK